jgi:hypothetical protein
MSSYDHLFWLHYAGFHALRGTYKQQGDLISLLFLNKERRLKMHAFGTWDKTSNLAAVKVKAIQLTKLPYGISQITRKGIICCIQILYET